MPGSRTIAPRALARLRKYATSRMSGSADFSGETFHRNLGVVDRLKKVAEEEGATLPELAVALTLAHPAVHVAIVGARRPSQLEGTASAVDLDLSGENLEEIDKILAEAVPVTGPNPEGM